MTAPESSLMAVVVVIYHCLVEYLYRSEHAQLRRVAYMCSRWHMRSRATLLDLTARCPPVHWTTTDWLVTRRRTMEKNCRRRLGCVLHNVRRSITIRFGPGTGPASHFDQGPMHHPRLGRRGQGHVSPLASVAVPYVECWRPAIRLAAWH